MTSQYDNPQYTQKYHLLTNKPGVRVTPPRPPYDFSFVASYPINRVDNGNWVTRFNPAMVLVDGSIFSQSDDLELRGVTLKY